MIVSSGRTFLFATCFSKPVRGTLWTDFGFPWGTPVQLKHFLNELESHFAAHVKGLQSSISILRKQMAPKRPSIKTSSNATLHAHNQSAQILFTFISQENRRKSQTPYFSKKVGETAEGIPIIISGEHANSTSRQHPDSEVRVTWPYMASERVLGLGRRP